MEENPSHIILFPVSGRADVDFTDMVWSAVAEKLTCYSELCNSLSLILGTIRQDEIRWKHYNFRAVTVAIIKRIRTVFYSKTTLKLFFRPFIYSKNPTRLAKIVGVIVREGGMFNEYNRSTGETLPNWLINLMESSYKDAKHEMR